MSKTVIIDAVRTPFGKFGGTLKNIPLTDLGSIVISKLCDRINIDKNEIDKVIMGSCIPTGDTQLPAREAAIKAHLPYSVSCLTINNACLSALHAVSLGNIDIKSNISDTIISGGMESMSRSPFIVPKARWGARMGDFDLIDIVQSALHCPFTGKHMGVYADEMAQIYKIDRIQQDKWAFRSQQNYNKALKENKFNFEIIPIEIIDTTGKSIIFNQDEFPKPETTLENLSKLKPVFRENGTITAGNSPGINDGATATLLMNEEKAHSLGLKPLALIVDTAEFGGAPNEIATVPAYAIQKLLKKNKLDISDIGLFEINEAFAAVTLTSIKILDINPDIVNVNGGSIAIGHPVGATGARILMTLIYEMKRENIEFGIAAICGAGAQGEAVLVKNI